MRSDFNSLINAATPVLVDFYAEWCGPCKAQAPILLEVARELSDKIRIIKIDVDKNPQVAGAYQVQGVPTLAVFKSGKLVYRQSGMHSKAQLMDAVKAAIG
ncbi:MAG: thioredoxin [Bacteroidota bacterium]